MSGKPLPSLLDAKRVDPKLLDVVRRHRIAVESIADIGRQLGKRISAEDRDLLETMHHALRRKRDALRAALDEYHKTGAVPEVEL